MAYQYQTISESDFGAGIDQQSAENQIKPGFVEDLVNGDPKPEGYLAKRPGYQGFAGYLPVRVSKVEYVNDKLAFTLDAAVTLTSVDLSSVRSSPLVVYGRMSSPLVGGDFTDTDSVKYYSGFQVELPKSLLVGTHTLNIPASEHAQGDTRFLPRTSIATSQVNTSNTQFLPDLIRIDKVTTDLDITYTNGDASGLMYVCYSNRDSSYKSSLQTVPANSTYSWTILSSTHSLTNFNILVDVLLDDVTHLESIEPDLVEISPTGDVTIQVTNQTGSSIQVFAYLTAAPLANTHTQTVGVGATQFQIPVSTDFPNPSVYVKNPVTNVLTQIRPHQISIDSLSGEMTIEVTTADLASLNYLISSNQANFVIYWEDLKVTANKLTVTANNIMGTFSDERPQLTIWGLSHKELYGTNPTSTRPGWVNYVDSYRTAGNNRVLAGLGGNIFAARTQEEVGSSHLLPTLYPSLRNRVSSVTPNQVIGPAFWGLNDSPLRGRGYIKFAGGEENWARASRIEFDANPLSPTFGLTKYTLETPNLVLSGSPISTSAPLRDQLTVQQAGYSINEGIFEIHQVSSSSSQLFLWVNNPGRDSTDFDEGDSGAQVGIFTDQLLLSSAHEFLLDDKLESDLFGVETYIQLASSDTLTIVLKGLTEELILPAGLRIIARRKGRVLPTRDIAETPSVTNLVRGDLLSFSDKNRLIRAKYINPLSNQSVTLSGDGSTCTLSFSSNLTSSFQIGQRILLVRAGEYSGEHVITNIPSLSSLEFEETFTSSETGQLIGKTVELDEEGELFDDPNNQLSLSVQARWIPIEAPTDSWNLTPSTYTSHFPASPYGEQEIIRSVMSSNNMYLTNGIDPVMKIDGRSIYRAGLPRWQPQAFITVDEDPSNLPVTGKITLPEVRVTSSARSGNSFTILPKDKTKFPIGSLIYDTANHEVYEITSITEDVATGDAYIVVDRTISSTASGNHDLTQVYTYRYYFRLNAVDINGNKIASAITGLEDCVVRVEHDSQIRIRLVGFPAWDNLDFSRLELQVYRTKRDQVAPYYRLASIPLPFSSTTDYVDFIDTYNDDELFDLDEVASVLTGQELGTQWSGPLKAKYVTSASNKLLLANVETDPYLDIRLLTNSVSSQITETNLINKRFLFRKDNLDLGTSTDNINRMAFEFVNTGLDVTGVVNNSGNSFTVTTGTNHGLAAGNWVYLTMSTNVTDWSYTSYDQGTEELINTVPHGYQTGERVVLYSNSPPSTTPPNQLVNQGVYYIIQGSTANRLKLATTLANALAGIPINLTGSGSTGNLEPHTQIRLEYMGWWQVASTPSLTSFTVTHSHSASYVPALDGWEVNKVFTASTKTDIPVFIGNDLGMENLSGNSTFIQNRAVDRLAKAINASQRVCRTSGFSPWMMAYAGQLYESGQLLVEQPRVLPTTMEVELPSFTEFDVFINNIKRTSGSQASAQSIRYPSRLLISYTNYPELFNDPTNPIDSQSSGVVDVNSADGQEITAIIPFFGQSAFGAALKSGVIVVFKSNSIYLVDLAAKASGINPVQRIESQGLGCTAPHSIANTKDGIMFANESGIYRLSSSLSIEYIGQKVERIWRERVNRDLLPLVFGHHYGTGSQYKVSVPLDGGTSPGHLLVYSHVREYRGGFGAWSRYSNHPSIGFCNLFSDAFFATTSGEVFSVRRTGEATDYRDDDQPVEFDALLRAMDFGDGGIRKVLSHVIAKFRVLGDMNGTTLLSATDMSESFTPADSFRVDTPANNQGGLNDLSPVKVQTIRFSIDDRKMVFIQIRFTNSSLDEPINITEISYRVAGMTDKGITSAART